MSIVARRAFKFPFRHTLKDGTRLVADKLPLSLLSKGQEMIESQHKMGIGFTSMEVEEANARLQHDSYYIYNEDNDDIVSIFSIYACPFARSSRPITHSGIVLVDPKYQGKGIGKAQYHILINKAIDMGFCAAVGRISITSKNVFASRAVGAIFTGVIPYAVPLPGTGLVDDLITYKDYEVYNTNPEVYQAMSEAMNAPLAPIQKLSSIPSHLMADHSSQSMEVGPPGAKIQIRPCRGNELWSCEEQWRSLAEKGLGFGVDEFTEQGHFNRKLFTELYVGVAEDKHGELVGSALFGPSVLSRGSDPIIAQNYVFVDDRIRRTGLGSSLLDYSMKNIKEMGFKGAISDNYLTNIGMLNLLRKRKYYVLGCLPLSAYVKGVGPSDSMIVFMPVNK